MFIGRASTFKSKVQAAIGDRLDEMLQERIDAYNYRFNANKQFENQKNLAYYDGVSALLRLHKQNHSPDTMEQLEMSSYFYRKVDPASTEIVSKGMPKILVDSMSRILFHNGITINEETNNALTSMLLDLSKKVLYSGAGAIQIGSDGSYTTYDRGNCYQDGDEIVFVKEFVEKKQKYVLETAIGYGYKARYLYKDGSPCELSDTKTTMLLEPREEFNPLIRPAVYITIGNSMFEGLYGLFNAVDAAATGLRRLNNKAKIRTSINATHLPICQYSEQPILPDKAEYDFIIYEDKPDGNGKPVEFFYEDYTVDNFIKEIDEHEQAILRKVGINKVSLGDAVEVGNPGYENRKLQEEHTVRTRGNYIRIFEPLVKEIAFTYHNIMHVNEGMMPHTREEFDKMYEVKIEDYLKKELTYEQMEGAYSMGVITQEEYREFLGLPPLEEEVEIEEDDQTNIENDDEIEE